MKRKLKIHLRGTPASEIHDVACPQNEYLILEILSDKEMTGAEVSRASGGKVRAIMAYIRLERLRERSLVTKKETNVLAGGLLINKITYSRSFDTFKLFD